MTHSLGSAERPASESSDPNAVRPVQPAQYMTVDDSPPGGYSESHRLAFYNIGWDRKSKKEWHTADGLATEICDMVLDKGIDAVGICEVFNLRDDSCWQQRQGIMKHVVSKLNSRAGRPATSAGSSAERPAWNAVRPAWKTVNCGQTVRTPETV